MLFEFRSIKPTSYSREALLQESMGPQEIHGVFGSESGLPTVRFIFEVLTDCSVPDADVLQA